MKILEISSGIASIVALIVTLYFQWQGDKALRNDIADVTLGLIMIFVLVRWKLKSNESAR